MPILLFNPASGRGRARRLAEELSWAVRHAGLEPFLLPCTEGPAALRAALTRLGPVPLIVVGGDGTLHHALPAAMDACAPLYHVPAGSENLFARAMGTDASRDRLLAALRSPRVIQIDAFEATGLADACPPSGVASPPQPAPSPRRGALMISIGPDASLVRRVEARRAAGAWGARGHAGFLLSGLAEAWSPCLPALRVSADDAKIVHDQPGMLIVASASAYALRIDPALRARVDDALLDAVFFPARSSLAAAAWMVRSRLRRHLDRPGLVYRSARAISVHPATHRELPVQIDGEPASLPAGRTLHIRILPRALHVLAPPDP